MKRHAFLCIVAVIFGLLAIVFSSCQKDTGNSYPYSLQFFTEEYAPFNYTDGGQLTGLAPEILKEVCLQLGIPFDVKVMAWDKAYAATLENGNAVLFSTALNAERKDLFKWAGPIASINWDLYSSAQNLLSIGSLEEAKTIGHIGVIRDYAVTQYLERQGFTNLVYVSDNVTALSRLLDGTIDLFPSDRMSVEATLNDMGTSYYAVNPRLRILTDMVYFAFNKNMPDKVVADFQTEIDRIRNNGLMTSLYAEFMQSNDIPESLLIYTEDYPPLTFLNAWGELTGFGCDIVQEIMKRNHIYNRITLSQWNIGYELALTNPNFCLFTMDRTPLRDTLFEWVGPLGTNATYFYTRNGSGITINSLEDARALSAVGTVSSWFSDQYLREQGFTNLISGGDPATMTEMLMHDQVDAFVCSGLTFMDILRSAGYSPDQVTPALRLMSSDFYIAFSLTTSKNMVDQWQQTFDGLKQDGTYDDIYAKWFR